MRADEGKLVTVENEATRFFAAGKEKPGAFGMLAASRRLPDLAKHPYVEARQQGNRFVGWRLGERSLLTSSYSLVRLADGVTFHAAKPLAALDRLKAEPWPSPHLLLTHWIAALRRGDRPVATVAWRMFRKRYDDGTRSVRANTRRMLHGELAYCWPTAWDGYTRTPLVLAALNTLEELSADDRQREQVRRARRQVRATPTQLPAIPGENAPAAERARAMVLHLRDLQPCVSIHPGGSLYLDTPPVKRLEALGRAAYPALVAALEHEGLTDAWVGRRTQSRFVTIGEAAAEVLRKQLGFLDEPALMRAWTASGTWKTQAATSDWFIEHARHPVVQEVNARRASKAAQRKHFARLYPQAQLAIAHQLEDTALARKAIAGLHRCGVDTHPRREEALACARRCEFATLTILLERLRPELQTVILDALSYTKNRTAIPHIVRHLTNTGHVFPPKPERAGPRAVRFYAARALERATGENFGAAGAETGAEWLAVVERAQAWASRRR